MKTLAKNRSCSSARLSLIVLAGLALASGAAAVCGQSALDGLDPNANGAIRTVVAQPDGKMRACGLFSSIGGQTRNYIARLDPVTGLADSFDPQANNFVYSIAVQADGTILAGGAFSTLAPNGSGAVTRDGIARLQIDGRLDATLQLSSNSTV